MEVRADRVQKVTAAFLVLVLTGFATITALFVLRPDLVQASARDAEGPWAQPPWLAVSGVCLAMAAWLCCNTVRFRLYYNEYGVGQTNGIRHRFVRWEQIACYTLEDTAVSHRRIHSLLEPVLRDADDQVLLRPMVPFVFHGSDGLDQRAEFWRQVAYRIDDSRGFTHRLL